MEIKHANRYYLIVMIIYMGMDLVWEYLPPVPDLIIEAVRNLLLILIGVMIILTTRSGLQRSLGLYRISWRTILWTMLLMVLSQPLSSLAVELSYYVSPDYIGAVWEELVLGNPVLDLLSVAVFPAVIEEFIFRGVLFQSWRQRSGRSLVTVAMLVGLEFGLFHLNLTQFSYAFALGALMCLLAEASGSIWAPVIFHFANNEITLIDDMLHTVDSPVAPFLPLQYLHLGTPYTAALTIVLSLLSIPLIASVLRYIARCEGREETFREAFRRRKKSTGAAGVSAYNKSGAAGVSAQDVEPYGTEPAAQPVRPIFTPSLVMVTAVEILVTGLVTLVLWWP